MSLNAKGGMGHSGSHPNAGGQVAVAFNARQDPIHSEDLAIPLDTDGCTQAIAFNLPGRDDSAQAEASVVASIRASSGGSSRSYGVPGTAVRRLTPRECERLQGFPDDYTLIPNYRRKIKAHEVEEIAAYLGIPVEEARELGATPDGPRYKAIGNSMAVPVMKWIGHRIDTVDRILREAGLRFPPTASKRCAGFARSGRAVVLGAMAQEVKP